MYVCSVTHWHNDHIGVDGVTLSFGAALQHEAGVGTQASNGGNNSQDGPDAAYLFDISVWQVPFSDFACQGKGDAKDHAEENKVPDV